MGAQGTATLNFGAMPGSVDTSVAVTGQGSILAGSLVEAWILPATTADHSADEHVVEPIQVTAGNIVAGVGFTIYGVMPDMPVGNTNSNNQKSDGSNGKLAMLHGAFNVGWVWN